jgi:hypothetical protein
MGGWTEALLLSLGRKSTGSDLLISLHRSDVHAGGDRRAARPCFLDRRSWVGSVLVTPAASYSPECLEKLSDNSQARARRLTIKRVIAA